MSSSSGRGIAAFIILAALVVSVVQFGLPAWTEYKEQSTQLQAAEQQLKAVQQTQAQKLENRQTLTDDEQDIISAALPTTFDQVRVEDVLRRSIEGAGAKVIGVQFNVSPADASAISPAPVEKEWPQSRLVSVEVSGKHTQIASALRALDSLMNVDPTTGIVTKGPVQGAMVLPVEGVNLTHTMQGMVTGTIYVRAFGS